MSDLGSTDDTFALPDANAAVPAAPGNGRAIVRTPELRAYQHDVVAKIEAAIAAGHRRILLVAPTGSGKTVIAGEIVRKTAAAGRKTLFLAHRRELIQQAAQKLYAVGVDHGIIQAGFPMRIHASAQIASIATLHARAVRSKRISIPGVDLIVLDEAHHAPAPTYRDILAAYPAATVLGMTATPCRGDGRGLGSAFDVLVECPPVVELVKCGFLVPTSVYAPSRPDLKGVRVRLGDYVESELAELMDDRKLVGDIVSHWHRLSERRKTVVFATGVAHSVHLRDEFRRSGVWAEHIDGTTPAEERDAILARLSAGPCELVTNAMVLTEGWDQPEVSCIVLARPTKHMGLYRQMVGRVLRPAPGKKNAIVLDHAGAVFEHGFVEEPVVWTLHKDHRAVNPVHAARGSHQNPELTACPECSAVRMQGHPCPQCGWRPQPKPRAIIAAEGELTAVDRNSRKAAPVNGCNKLDFYRQLIWIARDREYNLGWAAHQYRTRFNEWPMWRYLDPLEPDAATLAWVRSRQIAYARAKAKQAGGAA